MFRLLQAPSALYQFLPGLYIVLSSRCNDLRVAVYKHTFGNAPLAETRRTNVLTPVYI